MTHSSGSIQGATVEEGTVQSSPLLTEDKFKVLAKPNESGIPLIITLINNDSDTEDYISRLFEEALRDGNEYYFLCFLVILAKEYDGEVGFQSLNNRFPDTFNRLAEKIIHGIGQESRLRDYLLHPNWQQITFNALFYYAQLHYFFTKNKNCMKALFWFFTQLEEGENKQLCFEQLAICPEPIEEELLNYALKQEMLCIPFYSEHLKDAGLTASEDAISGAFSSLFIDARRLNPRFFSKRESVASEDGGVASEDDLTELYGEAPVYYENVNNYSSAHTAKSQLLTLLDKIISLKPEALAPLNAFLKNIKDNLSIPQRPCLFFYAAEELEDRNETLMYVLHAIKKQIEYFYITLQQRLRDLSAEDVKNMTEEMNLCIPGACSNLIRFFVRVNNKFRGLTGILCDAKRELLTASAQEVVSHSPRWTAQSGILEVHVVNGILNHLSEPAGLTPTEDIYANKINLMDKSPLLEEMAHQLRSSPFEEAIFQNVGVNFHIPLEFNSDALDIIAEKSEGAFTFADLVLFYFDEQSGNYINLSAKDAERIASLLTYRALSHHEFLMKSCYKVLSVSDKTFYITCDDIFVSSQVVVPYMDEKQEKTRPARSEDLDNAVYEKIPANCTALQYLPQDVIISIDVKCAVSTKVFSLLAFDDLTGTTLTWLANQLADDPELLLRKNHRKEALVAQLMERRNTKLMFSRIKFQEYNVLARTLDKMNLSILEEVLNALGTNNEMVDQYLSNVMCHSIIGTQELLLTAIERKHFHFAAHIMQKCENSFDDESCLLLRSYHYGALAHRLEDKKLEDEDRIALTAHFCRYIEKEDRMEDVPHLPVFKRNILLSLQQQSNGEISAQIQNKKSKVNQLIDRHQNCIPMTWTFPHIFKTRTRIAVDAQMMQTMTVE